MKNFIFIIILTFLSTIAFSQNKNIKSSKAEPHEKTNYSEKGLLKSKKKKKKNKKSKKSDKASKTDYSTKKKKETKKRKAIDAAPNVDPSNNRKKTARKVSTKL